MLNQLAAEIVSRSEKYAQLQKMASQSQAVRDTAGVIDEINSQVHKWADVFVAISPLLQPESVAAFRMEAAQIARLLIGSRDDFALENFQQAIKLTQLKARVEKLRSRLKEEWCSYAVAKVAPYVALKRIADRLPKMARQLDTIEGFLANADALAREIPSKSASVAQFNSHLIRLKSLLGDLEGLPPDVRIFLDKLLRGDATFADVTQTVFDWCRDEGLADKLRIARF